MFVIEKDKNSIKAIEKRTFSELEFKERAHLQEWIAGNPEALGEKLLIIQKEFSGFNDTNERLDLLALDKDGNIVVIENKLDDSGKDVTWQALKYAAYSSTLTKEQIEEVFQSYLKSQGKDLLAKDVLTNFFEDCGKSYSDILVNKGSTQRIILVAANFRKEVTSTVLWLMNFKVQVQCIKATPYTFDNQYFLTLDQIIPTKDAQDYVISMANKIQEEITSESENQAKNNIRQVFWAKFLDQIKGKSTLFQNSNPTRDHWLVAGGTGITYATYQVVVSMAKTSVMVNFGRPSKDENKLLFDSIYANKDVIEKNFGLALEWERMDDYKSSKICFSKNGINFQNEEEWNSIIQFLIENITKLELAMRPFMSDARNLMIEKVKEWKEEGLNGEIEV